MKQRVISALVAIAILLPIILIGGKVFYLGLTLIAIIGLFEMIKAKETEKSIPLEIKTISLLSYILILINRWQMDLTLDFSKRVIIVMLFLIMPVIFYKKKEKYNIVDALFILGVVLLLGIGFNKLGIIRIENPVYFAYLIIITTMTDTFAYVGGSLIGKHKLAPSISPNKTIEGLVTGVVMGTTISTIVINSLLNVAIFKAIIISSILCLISQAGDLLFSAIKRHFKIKDYGNLMPGHGGVLDRLDSLLVLTIVFSLISNLI